MELPVDPARLSVEEILENLQAGHRRAVEEGPQAALDYLQKVLRDTIELPSAALMVIYDHMSEAQAELMDWEGCAASLARAQEERKRARTGASAPRPVPAAPGADLPLGWLSERIDEPSPAEVSQALVRRTFAPEDFAGLLDAPGPPPVRRPASATPDPPPRVPALPPAPILMAPPASSAAWQAPVASATVTPGVSQDAWPSVPAPAVPQPPTPAPRSPARPAVAHESPRKLCRTCGRDVTHRSRTKDPKTNTYLCSRCFDDHVRTAGRGLPTLKRPLLWIVALALLVLAIVVLLGLSLGGHPA